jgi:hypothetical protein
VSGLAPIWAGYPRSYTPGRSRAPQFCTIHYTAGATGPTAAEAGVSYDKTRTDGTSCHGFVDAAGPWLQEVPFGDRSHSAYFHGNEIGIHLEICTTVQSRASWLGPTYPTLVQAAGACRWICDQLGFPLRRLTTAETRAAYFNPAGQRPFGINDHAAITAAFPEDPGTHTDVGVEFPWDVFMQLVGASSGSAPAQEDEMTVRLIGPSEGYGANAAVRVFPTDLGMALEILNAAEADLPVAAQLWGDVVYCRDARVFGTPIEELEARWAAMGGPAGGLTDHTHVPGGVQ